MDNKTIQESLIEPIITVNKMFLEQMANLKESYGAAPGSPNFPDIFEGVREHLQELILAYEEDKEEDK